VKVWGNLKKGDKAIQVYCLGERGENRHDVVVKSVGRRWITVADKAGRKVKFAADNGYGEYGFSLHTEATLVEADRRNGALHTIRRQRWDNVETDALIAVAKILDTAAPV
jgi:hypothetical protein